MKKDIQHLYFDYDERMLLIQSLNSMRNQLIAEGRYTDVVDEVLLKVMKARVKKVRVVYT